MLYIFYILAGLLIVQSVFSLIEGIQFLSFIRRSIKSDTSGFAPRAAIIAPCKGMDPALEENLRALFDQNYADYEIIFVIADPADPAAAVIKKLMADCTDRRARLIVAGVSRGRSEKVNNLLAALDHVGRGCEVLAFVDSDARVHPDWLGALVAPLDDDAVGATTGYRWYLPERGGFWPAVLSAWNGSVATTLGDHDHNFAWGGSTAIKLDVFYRLGVSDRWQQTASDDYALTRAARDAGLRIRFVPRCLIVSRQDASLAWLMEFTTRQIIITRVYRPRMWWVGLISHALFSATFFGGLVWTILSAISGANVILSTFALTAIYLLGSTKGLLRLTAASQALPAARRDVTRLWWMFCMLWPLVSLVFLYNFIRSATTRRITWRGIRYELRSPTETNILKDEG
jgi:ceramide glucosyltransferase